jgi:hypothetical protein
MTLGQLFLASVTLRIPHSLTSIPKETLMATLSCLSKNHRAASNVCDRFAMAGEDDLFQSDRRIPPA